MDLEKFRASWGNSGFKEEFPRLVPPETPLHLYRTLERDETRAERWRNFKRILIQGTFALLWIVMGFLTAFDFLNHKESRHQTLASLISIVIAAIAMPRILKQRDQYALPRLHLPYREFLADEQNRLETHIRLDRRVSWLLAAAIACVGVYFAPLAASLSVEVVYISAMLGLIVGCQLYDRWKIRQLEAARDDLARQLQGLLRDGE